jgi:N-acetylglucosamine malate deacetylase 2
VAHEDVYLVGHFVFPKGVSSERCTTPTRENQSPAASAADEQCLVIDTDRRTLTDINEEEMNHTTFHKLGLAICLTLLLSIGMFAQVPGKTLLVVAHPDDEYYFAATVYRMAVQLGGTVDELIITNGEGGFHYSSLAEPYYEKPLTIEATGRKELPAIRKEETLNAGKVLGIKDHYFLDQKDEKLTTDSNEGLTHLWDTTFVTNTIADLIKGRHYQYVFVVLPRSTTHGHHQAATVLASRAIQSIPEASRPVLLGFDTEASDYTALATSPETNGWATKYAFAFDRNTAFGFHNALSYQVVVNWMIAEHKSQGLLQTMYNKDAKEYLWIDLRSSFRAQSATAALFKLLFPNSPEKVASK